MCGSEQRNRAGGFGREPANRLQLRDARSHRVDDAPASGQGPERDGAVRRQHDPQVDAKRRNLPAGQERSRDDAHRLLRIVAAVPEAVGRGGQQLQPPEPMVDSTR